MDARLKELLSVFRQAIGDRRGSRGRRREDPVVALRQRRVSQKAAAVGDACDLLCRKSMRDGWGWSVCWRCLGDDAPSAEGQESRTTAGGWGDDIAVCGFRLPDGVVINVAVAVGIVVADAATVTIVGRRLEGRSVGRRAVVGLKDKGKAED